MWRAFSGILLRNKLAFTIGILLVSIFMGYQATRIELSYEFAQILPDTDSTYIEYQNFKKQFGEDGSVMAVGFNAKDFFTVDKFNDWYKLSQDFKNIQGIKDVLSVPTLSVAIRNDSLSKFDFPRLVTGPLKSQAEADSIKAQVQNLSFYDGIIYNKENQATLMAITFHKKDLDSKRRIKIVEEIKILSEAFSKKHNVEMHYSGMPYIRTQYMIRVSGEMTMFLILAVIVTAIILWLFFRSFTSVFFSLIVVIIGVIWSIGILQLFGYKITVLTGLLAPLIMVIGIPNCIFLINKYYSEFALHGNKVKALARTIETIGITLFLANVTTAIGFGVLYFTQSSLLVEFGVVSAIGVMATYLITLILIPVIYSYLPVPKEKHTKRLEGKRITAVLNLVDNIVHTKRKAVYITIGLVTIISFIGMRRIDLVGFVVDDLPTKDPIYSDLHFFETNFKGILPFEISVDTKKEKGIFAENAKAVYKLKALQKIMAQHEEFSKPLSLVEGIKFLNQAYKGGHPKYYNVPGITDLKELSEFQGTVKGKGNSLSTFIDSSNRITRVSYRVADIGSKKMDVLLNEIKPKIDSLFPSPDYKVTVTGHSLVFLKNNSYLLSNLFESLIIEILLITLVGIALFRSIRIIILSKLPCLIPLVITAGIMGFLDIRFKPSTILIFSIAFGISSDGTIYFLTKYRQELKNKRSASEAISAAIKDTGLSMIYTAVILFFGFAIFAASSFGGTVALGVLVSLTLIISMVTNLVLLPSILLTIDNRRNRKEILEEPLIEIKEDI
jgi:predicted RND superfamily exporter protein